MKQKIDAAVAAIRKVLPFTPQVAIVLGSGLGGLAEKIEGPVYLPYGDIPGFKVSTAPGHAGRFVAGQLAGKPVICMQGRLHFYEGHTMQEIAFPVRVLKALGVQALVLTNAAGGVNKSFSVGDLMLIEDHINFMGANPLTGLNDDAVGPRFCDMSFAYTPALRELACRVAGHTVPGAHALPAGRIHQEQAWRRTGRTRASYSGEPLLGAAQLRAILRSASGRAL